MARTRIVVLGAGKLGETPHPRPAAGGVVRATDVTVTAGTWRARDVASRLA